MHRSHTPRPRRPRTSPWTSFLVGVVLAGCGGGTGTEQDSGANKTYLRVEAVDPDGDTLSYQWRVTAGHVDNRNARETVWTMPDGPGLHFAYVVVSDGKGGYAEQQYAVTTDTLDTPAPERAPVSHDAPALNDFEGTAGRLRFVSPDDTEFVPPGGGSAQKRTVYLPDMAVQVLRQSNGETVFSGLSDLSGEVNLPKLHSGEAYLVRCASTPDGVLVDCGNVNAGSEAGVRSIQPPLDAARNLRLHGHVAFADGSTCGLHNEFFGLQSAATVQLQQPDGTALGAALRVNRFGDYALDAAVPVRASLKLEVRCDGSTETLDVPAAAGAAGYVASEPVELSHALANQRPTIARMVANGPEGNVRGRMIVAAPGVASNGLPGPEQFLTYKGRDSRLSACQYYRALGAAKDCDAQGNMIEPISFEDWKRLNKFKPYEAGATEVAANYINKMDLNLVRRMVATQSGPQDIAFYVCNHPGPEGQSQEEVDEVMTTALVGGRHVACVAMAWSPSPGVNGGRPFTKFYTFGPDGSLLTSINLDFRGEKYMPGACVACHGGTQYNGRFPEKGNPSPYLGAGFLPFDTGNYYFATGLGEASQSDSLHGLNQLVRKTEGGADTSVTRLIDGWYAGGGTTLDKRYVPKAWQDADAQPATAGAAHFYREVVGASCRTCHVSLGPRFDWDSTVLTPARARTHVCGGSADIVSNAAMPNALVSRDRVAERIRADAELATLMNTFLGCDKPSPDPVYPRR